MRTVVFSSTSFGRHCIEQAVLRTDGVDLVGILTTPEEIVVPYSNEPVVIRTHATFRDLQCETRRLTRKPQTSDYIDVLSAWDPNLILVLGWYYIVPSAVRELASDGCLGIHASLLPKYRGGAPIPWAIIQGEKESGVTLFHLDDSVDAGDIVAQERFAIEHDDSVASVYNKVVACSVTMLREYLPLLAQGRAPRTPQDERQATYFPQRSPEDGEIDWSWEPERIRDFIRAQTKPYPGAYTYIAGKKVTIWDADVESAE